MALNDIILGLIKDYASRTKNPVMDFPALLSYVKKQAESAAEKDQFLSILKQAPETVLISELENLAAEGTCALTYDDVNIKTVHFSDYYVSLVAEAYEAYKRDNEQPFPNEEILGLSLPQETVTVVNVKEDFMRWLGYEQQSKEALLRLQFPEDFKSMIITSGLFFNELLTLALSKIRVYLRTKRNLNYIQNKMIGLFPEKDRVTLREMMDTVFDRPEHAADTVRNPTEFTFRFWASLANQIIMEFKPKANKLAEEICYAQAAYIVGFYNAFYKNKLQKARDEEAALKSLDMLLKKSPYFFSVTDIYNFRDKKGVPLLKKYSKDTLHSFLKSKTGRESGAGLPELLRLKVSGNKEYFVHKDVYVPLTIKKAEDASLTYRKRYIDSWLAEMKQFRKPTEASSDRAFERDLEDKVTTEEPFLRALLRFEVLYLLREEAKLGYETAKEITRYFEKDGKSLIPLSGILRLRREELLSYARSLLPVWQTIPVLSGIIVFLKRLFSGKRKQGKSAAGGKGGRGTDLSETFKSLGPPEFAEGEGGAEAAIAGGNEPGDRTENTAAAGRGTPTGNGAGRGGHAETGPSPAGGQKTAKAQLAVYRETVQSLAKHFVAGHKSMDAYLSELSDKWNPLYDPQARKNLVEDVNVMVRDFVRGLKRRIIVKPPDIEGVRTMAERLSNNDAFKKIKKKDYFRAYLEVYIVKLMGKV